MGVMALMGFAHFQGHSHSGGAHGHGHVHLDVNTHGVHGHGAGAAHGGHVHPGHGHVHGAPAPHGQAAQGSPAAAGHSTHQHGHGAAQETPAPVAPAPNALMQLLPLMSPLNWFSWMVGAGAAGLLARTYVGEPWAAAAAAAGAVVFHQGVVKPVWRLVFGFASEPAGNLESCLLQEVEAVTSFDARGEGLVRVVIDGRSEDVLARLAEGDRSGTRVRRGDRLLIEDVDSATNRCLVSRV